MIYPLSWSDYTCNSFIDNHIAVFDNSRFGALLLVVIVPSGITLVNLLFVHSAFLVQQYSFNLLSPISLLAKTIDLSLLYKLALDSKAQIQKNTGQSGAKRLLDSCIFSYQ